MGIASKSTVFVPTFAFMLIYNYGYKPGFENIFVT